MKIHSENLAYWYFRINGFFTMTNFIIHPDYGREQRTDVDIMAVRFPYRAELLENTMKDDDIFFYEKNRIYLILAEVKLRTCNLNGPWTDRTKKNMQRALRAAGPLHQKIIDEAASSLYNSGIYVNDDYKISLFCVGKKVNDELKIRYPDVPQVEWMPILSFMYDRFQKYKNQKHGNAQWDETGRYLYRKAIRSSKQEFIDKIQYQLQS